jgi:type II secretory ATPase GspE/PulE/Tfp pilus assembly ATPase PilB-like protein
VDLLAAKFLPVVRFTGVIGLFIFVIVSMIRFIFRQTHKGDICPYCKKRIDNIDAYTDYNFRICPHCHENIVPVYSLEDYIFHLVDNVQKNMQKRAGYKVDTNLLEKDAMLKLIRAVVTLAFRKRASDLHIEPDNEGLKIRARIDGMLYEIMNLPRQVGDAIVSAIKVMSNLDISEKRIPQDGRISIWVDRRDLDLRISTSPIAQGEKVSMRLLDPTEILVDSTKLGLDGENLEKFERAIRKPYGLILVTGPSGSGKSTTLYVALHTVNTGDKNIVTIEDPVEYKLEGISQQQVHVEANFTFATGLRSILRQDPDVIMVGEIRDKDTADIAIDAATTGHLVLTTLHTIDTANAFGRLTDLGVPTRRYAPILISIIAQRLLRLNCPNCKKPYTPKKSDLELLDIDEKMGIVFIKGMGCGNCNNSGFYGRTGIFEILMPDEEMKKLLETNPAVSVIGALARRKGMKTLKEEGVLKINRSLTTVEEVLRVTM